MGWQSRESPFAFVLRQFDILVPDHPDFFNRQRTVADQGPGTGRTRLRRGAEIDASLAWMACTPAVRSATTKLKLFAFIVSRTNPSDSGVTQLVSMTIDPVFVLSVRQPSIRPSKEHRVDRH